MGNVDHDLLSNQIEFLRDEGFIDDKIRLIIDIYRLILRGRAHQPKRADGLSAI
jgi:hypothetical protein